MSPTILDPLRDQPHEVKILDELTPEQSATFRLLLGYRFSASLAADLYDVMHYMEESTASTAFLRLVDIFSGTVIKMPTSTIVQNCARDAIIHHSISAGAKPANLASRYGLTQSAIWKIFGDVGRLIERGKGDKEVQRVDVRGSASNA